MWDVSFDRFECFEMGFPGMSWKFWCFRFKIIVSFQPAPALNFVFDSVKCCELILAKTRWRFWWFWFEMTFLFQFARPLIVVFSPIECFELILEKTSWKLWRDRFKKSNFFGLTSPTNLGVHFAGFTWIRTVSRILNPRDMGMSLRQGKTLRSELVMDWSLTCGWYGAVEGHEYLAQNRILWTCNQQAECS